MERKRQDGDSTRYRFRSRPWLALTVIALFGAISSGCPSPTPSSPDATRSAPATDGDGAPLRVIVFDDPRLGQLIAREWLANSSQPLRIDDRRSDQVLQAPLNADVIIFPTVLLGELVASRQIVPWPLPLRDPDNLADSDVSGPQDYGWHDILPWLRRRELRWGDQVYGVSLGSPQLLLIYRADLLDDWQLEPPSTWQEYAQLIHEITERIAQNPMGPIRFATLEPVAPNDAAATFLARAASYARNPNQVSALFQFNSMTPLIDQPPFVRALNELKDAVSQLPPDVRALGRSAIIHKLLAGETVMAIGWPSGARESTIELAENASFKIQQLPGSTETYPMSRQTWQTRPDSSTQSVPLLGAAGRIGAVARRARSLESASNFLMWCTASENALRISAKCPSTTLFRQSQTANPRVWVEQDLAPVAGDFSQAMLANQQAPHVLFMPRIPGQHRYYSSLDAAVRESVEGRIAPADALQSVSDEWSEITRQLGMNAQRSAYESSLGLSF